MITITDNGTPDVDVGGDVNSTNPDKENTNVVSSMVQS